MKTSKCMKDLAIFSTMSISERNKIGELAGKRVYHKGEHIFCEGETAETIYLIKSGKVKLYKVSESGKEIILDILKEEDLLGENTFLDGSPHTMNAQALEDTFICSCSKTQFLQLLQNPQTALKIIQLLGEKVNSYTSQVASIAFLDVRGRVVSTLARLSQQYGVQTHDGTTIEIDLTHYDLASLVNASRVMVSNVIGLLRDEGLIRTKGQRFTLLKPEKFNEPSLSQAAI